MCNAKQRHHRNSRGPGCFPAAKLFALQNFKFWMKTCYDAKCWELYCQLLRITMYLPDCKLLKACFLNLAENCLRQRKMRCRDNEWESILPSHWVPRMDKNTCNRQWTKTINNRQKQAYHKNNSPAFKHVSLRTRRIDNMLKACLCEPIIQSLMETDVDIDRFEGFATCLLDVESNLKSPKEFD